MLSLASGELRSLRDELAPLAERVRLAALGDVVLLDEALGDHHVRQRIDQRHVGAGLELQVLVGLDVRGAHQLDLARIGDDQLRALAQAALQLRGEHRVAVGRIGADDEHVSAFMTESKACVPADSPRVFFRP